MNIDFFKYFYWKSFEAFILSEVNTLIFLKMTASTEYFSKNVKLVVHNIVHIVN